MEITVRNINHAFKEAWWRIKVEGVIESSRNGPVLVLPTPMLTTYRYPQERVLFNPIRDANPVFHLVEALWMLAGRDDVASLLPFNSQYDQYAEEDGRVHGAYGNRWMHTFGKDQIEEALKELKRDPATRRAVVAMWDPRASDMEQWKDTPCNTHIYFDARDGDLNMTVCCRSNDMLWGAYGANVVHFSILQELMALELGLGIGVYRQFSNNFHVYIRNDKVKYFLDNPPFDATDYYTQGPTPMGLAMPFPLLAYGEKMKDFVDDCILMFDESADIKHSYKTQFFKKVAAPLAQAYLFRKDKNTAIADLMLSKVAECDWKIAYQEWKERRNVSQ